MQGVNFSSQWKLLYTFSTDVSNKLEAEVMVEYMWMVNMNKLQ